MWSTSMRAFFDLYPPMVCLPCTQPISSSSPMYAEKVALLISEDWQLLKGTSEGGARAMGTEAYLAAFGYS